nr:hypothetical protein CFP56_62606 [Quercus suber]
MAGELAAGCVVGAAFAEGFAILHETVKHVVGQIIMFKSILKSLESTLDGVAPVVQEIRRLSLALGHPEKETKSTEHKDCVRDFDQGESEHNDCVGDCGQGGSCFGGSD